jgi:uncharacterized membrane protein YhaH (DUF805 family)
MVQFLLSPTGRIGRAQWWLAGIVHFATFVAIAMLVLSLSKHTSALGLLIVFPLLGLQIWSTFCTTVKRYHDRNKSSWWYAFTFIPVVGPIWAFVELGFLPGDLHENDYGEPGGNAGFQKELQSYSGQKDVSQYDRAIEAAVLASRTAPVTQTVHSYAPPTNSGNDRPVFGKRI